MEQLKKENAMLEKVADTLVKNAAKAGCNCWTPKKEPAIAPIPVMAAEKLMVCENIGCKNETNLMHREGKPLKVCWDCNHTVS